MLMTVAWIEVLVGVAGQIAQSLDLILNRMGVDNVHDDGKTVSVRLVNQGFQLFGGAET